MTFDTPTGGLTIFNGVMLAAVNGIGSADRSTTVPALHSLKQMTRTQLATLRPINVFFTISNNRICYLGFMMSDGKSV